MVTPSEAETLAQSAIETYVNGCQCKTVDDVANVVTKLMSMAGLALCGVKGQSGAIEIIESVALHVAKPKYATVRFERVVVN